MASAESWYCRHLGFYCNESTPTFRGFSSFFGYFNGAEDYYDHTLRYYPTYDPSTYDVNHTQGPTKGLVWCVLNNNCTKGVDLQRSTAASVAPTAQFGYNGTYSTTLLTDEAVAVIHAHYRAALDADADTKPLLLYLAYQANHSPLQVPDKYLAPFAHVTNEARRTFLAMVAALDEGVGRVVSALNTTVCPGLEGCIVLFNSDNGAQVREGGNNWPLR